MSTVTTAATRRPRICFVTAVPSTVNAFLRDHIQVLQAEYDVTVISDFAGTSLDLPGVQQISVPIARPISPRRDLRALWRLVRLFRAAHFDVVHSVTPKAGLLTGLAGRLAGVPVRIHWFTGQVWATRQGLGRLVLRAADKVIAGNATHRLVDSPSQRDFLVAEGVLDGERATVLAQGSICGVDTRRFHPDPVARAEVRAAHGIADSDELVLFLGRFNRDKGLLDLAHAFRRLAATQPQLQLMVVGPDEENLWPEIAAICADFSSRLHRVDFTRAPERYMAAADIFCLPSYREGFGSVVIEAAACAVPSVASRIYGVTDAVEQDRTGLLFNAGDVDDLVMTMARLLGQPALRQSMGEAGRHRAEQSFSREVVTAALLAYYHAALGTTAPLLAAPGR